MGSWRKVGAFLGLVPDDQRHDEDGGGGEYGGDYQDAHYPDGRDHDPHADYESDHRDVRGYAGFDGPSYPDRDFAPRGSADRGHERAGGRSYEPLTQGALAVKPDAIRREPDTAARPATVKLTGFGEARVIGEKYRDGQSVILDMTDMSDGDARRLVDFSAGLAFSLRGSIEKVAPKVFMLLPADSDVSALSVAASMGR